MKYLAITENIEKANKHLQEAGIKFESNILNVEITDEFKLGSFLYGEGVGLYQVIRGEE